MIEEKKHSVKNASDGKCPFGKILRECFGEERYLLRLATAS